MPLELQIIRASEFVRLDPQEILDFNETKAALMQLAKACRKRGINSALLDLRTVTPRPKPVFTPKELAALVGSFHEAGFTRHQKLAVLYRSDPHHGVRLFAFIGSIRGWQVRAFSDFEVALHWLSEEKGGCRDPEESEVPVNVVRRKVETRFKTAKMPVDRSGDAN
jgi:hypothetical protein